LPIAVGCGDVPAEHNALVTIRFGHPITVIKGLLDKYPIEYALLRFSDAGETSFATGLAAPPIFATGHSVDSGVGPG
jgi:hypothetical protein